MQLIYNMIIIRLSSINQLHPPGKIKIKIITHLNIMFLKILQQLKHKHNHTNITSKTKNQIKSITYEYFQHHTMETLNYKLSPLSVAVGTLVKIDVIRSK